MPSLSSRALYAAVGAISPDVLILYSKRWSMPALTFDVRQYAAATICYIGVAAVVATIYPFGGKPSKWKAFLLGVGLPLVVSGAATLSRGQVISPRGLPIKGTLLDLLSLF